MQELLKFLKFSYFHHTKALKVRKGSHGLHMLEIWYSLRDKSKNLKPQTYAYCHSLIINFICRASIWTQNSREWWRVPEFAESDDLVWSNGKIVAGERPQEPVPQIDSGRLDPRSCSNSYCDRISSSAESSEPCLHSIRKAEIPNFEVLVVPWTPLIRNFGQFYL